MIKKRWTQRIWAYLFALGLFLSGILTSCYGSDIDNLENDMTGVKNDLETLKQKVKEIEDEIANMDWVTDVSQISGTPGGWRITLRKAGVKEIYNGNQGASGNNGSNGKDGTIWYIGADSLWHSKPDLMPELPGTTPPKAIAEDGKEALSPQVIDGKWCFFTWNKGLNEYDTTYTKFIADTTRSYLVDKGNKYELYFPMKEPDTTSVKGDSILAWRPVYLPKFQEESLVINFKGFGRLKGDTITLMTDGLSFDLWRVASSPSWTGPKPPLAKDTILSTLQDTIVYLFSTNKGGNANLGMMLGLTDSRGNSLNFFSVSSPLPLPGNTLFTKATSADSLYYAKMIPLTKASGPSANMINKGNIFYYLVDVGGVKSTTGHTINAHEIESVPDAESGIYKGVKGSPGQVPATDRYGKSWVINPDTEYEIILTNRENIYDVRIDTVGLGDTNGLSLINQLGASSFKYSTATALTATDSIPITMVLHKLQKTGELRYDTVKVVVTAAP
ncbi:hypothetical protein AGMMS49574_24130 [Bacteroidia bacterium]|nr:hypothetical protein AGMMS49574_24130 [Bacteroidia bacterium]GHV03644.1 hypothetical protein FACS189416_0380 [Bacteroidia bacterium]